MKNTYWDCDYYSIYEENGEKYIKFWGYFYECDDDFDEAVEFCNAYIKLKEFLKDRSMRDTVETDTKQYIVSMTEDEAIEEMSTYYDGNPPTPYPLEDVTMETPCGDYVDVRR